LTVAEESLLQVCTSAGTLLTTPTTKGKVMAKKSYELMVFLTKKESLGIAEWHESTTVEADSMTQAKRMAWEFARQEAQLAGAKIHDAFAIDDETGEQSQ
jgi:hypothetical protein